jgi:hypothetical protein
VTLARLLKPASVARVEDEPARRRRDHPRFGRLQGRFGNHACDRTQRRRAVSAPAPAWETAAPPGRRLRGRHHGADGRPRAVFKRSTQGRARAPPPGESRECDASPDWTCKCLTRRSSRGACEPETIKRRARQTLSPRHKRDVSPGCQSASPTVSRGSTRRGARAHRAPRSRPGGSRAARTACRRRPVPRTPGRSHGSSSRIDPRARY